ncbi:hypothetical protein KL930_000449 [Ogataea haglerorum]|uniref:Uncharacterized protein n=1 Tax=Ogataea haglerorum TaxID=1937702 RepID=A0AAN6D5E8_9ASCO|nr:hypothetical protein KL951_004457 [Ogataea haglerorum]KAG7701098.1 hypothetical protein KL915_000129 [Ogataea haglerorum]KAG7705996.1 hypothetical protein KL950_003572 [Ogataea haglerorum]KAG7709056.1 hypothetical protein KL914_001446 [Ogataea haglerorum]KAG7715184.1 hypothetical protein KL913_004016 [Ogataea haglerorum]
MAVYDIRLCRVSLKSPNGRQNLSLIYFRMVLNPLRGYHKEGRPRSSSSITSTLNRLQSRMSTPTRSKSPKKIKTAFDNLSDIGSASPSPKLKEEPIHYGSTNDYGSQRGSLRSMVSHVENMIPVSISPVPSANDTPQHKASENCPSFRNILAVDSLRSYLTSGATDEETRPILPVCEADCASSTRNHELRYHHHVKALKRFISSNRYGFRIVGSLLLIILALILAVRILV